MSLESFTKKGRAEAAVRTGKAKIAAANTRGNVGFGDSGNQAKLDLARSGAQDMLEGTRERNRADGKHRPPMPTADQLSRIGTNEAGEDVFLRERQDTTSANDRKEQTTTERITSTAKRVFLKLTE